MICSEALKILYPIYAPELYAKENHLGSFYKNHPILSRLTIVPLATVSGFFKVILFPLISAIGVVALPLIALARACQKEEDAGAYLQAAGICLLGCLATVAFLGITGFHVPITYASGLFVTALAVSITIHVYMASREPQGSRPSLLATS